jgi:MoaA/NifB/PqqE/SkfB family radical SAM enzyme
MSAISIATALSFVSRKPSTLRVELTNHCNLRCKMCGIWEEKPKKTITPVIYEEVLSEPVLSRLRLISLTGGEPFLLDDLDEYYRIARRVRPRAHVNVSSNGYYTDRTIGFFEKTEPGTASLTISYDGVRSHDAVRGVEGSAARLLATAIAIRDRFPWIPLSLKLTVNNYNYGEISDTAEQCRALRIPFRFKTLEKLQCHQNRYPSEITGPDYSAEVRASIREQAEHILSDGAETNRRYLGRLVRKFSGANTSCSCSPRTFFLGVDGKVFLCRKHDPIGNVFEASFDAIWHAKERKERLRDMRTCAGDPMELGYTND